MSMPRSGAASAQSTTAKSRPIFSSRFAAVAGGDSFPRSSFWKQTKIVNPILRRFVCLFLLAVGMVVGHGCSDGLNMEHTVSARGILTHKGQPLANYALTLQPVAGERGAAGETNEQGHFVLGTNSAGDGAPPGKHRVGIAYLGPPAARPDGQNNFTAPQPQVKLAAKYASPETSGLTVEVPPGGSIDLKIEVP
jgi:hypothetical protein